MLKIGIVGADGRKWSKERERFVKDTIVHILLADWTTTKEPFVPQPRGQSFVMLLEENETERKILDDLRSRISEDIVMISGGCPVGRLRYWSHYHQRWDDTDEACCASCWGTTVTKAYDEGGVDTWAEIVADILRVQKDIQRPSIERWNDYSLPDGVKCSVCGLDEAHTHKGFKSRNIDMAKIVDILYVISPRCDCVKDKFLDDSGDEFRNEIGLKDYVVNPNCTVCRGTGRRINGGEWTGDYAENLGKKVVRVAI